MTTAIVSTNHPSSSIQHHEEGNLKINGQSKSVHRSSCSSKCFIVAALIVALVGTTLIVLSRMQILGSVNSAGSFGALGAGSALILGSLITLAAASLKKSSSSAKESSFVKTSPPSTTVQSDQEDPPLSPQQEADLNFFEALTKNKNLSQEIQEILALVEPMSDLKQSLISVAKENKSKYPRMEEEEIQARAYISGMTSVAIKANRNPSPSSFLATLNRHLKNYQNNRFALITIMSYLCVNGERELCKALFNDKVSAEIFLNAFEKESDLFAQFCLYFDIFPVKFLQESEINFLSSKILSSQENSSISKETKIFYISSLALLSRSPIIHAFAIFAKTADISTCHECIRAILRRLSQQLPDFNLKEKLERSFQLLTELLENITNNERMGRLQAQKKNKAENKKVPHSPALDIHGHLQEFLLFTLLAIKQQQAGLPASNDMLVEYYIYAQQIIAVEDKKADKAPKIISQVDFEHLVRTLPLKALLKDFFKDGIAVKAETILTKPMKN